MLSSCACSEHQSLLKPTAPSEPARERESWSQWKKILHHTIVSTACTTWQTNKHFKGYINAITLRWNQQKVSVHAKIYAIFVAYEGAQITKEKHHNSLLNQLCHGSFVSSAVMISAFGAASSSRSIYQAGYLIRLHNITLNSSMHWRANKVLSKASHVPLSSHPRCSATLLVHLTADSSMLSD